MPFVRRSTGSYRHQVCENDESYFNYQWIDRTEFILVTLYFLIHTRQWNRGVGDLYCAIVFCCCVNDHSWFNNYSQRIIIDSALFRF